MLAEGKTAILFGGGGAVGSAVAGVLAREGARVLIGGRTQGKLDRVADSIRQHGGRVETFIVDVLDTDATFAKAGALAASTGGFDIAVNATSFLHDQGTELAALSLQAFMRPLETVLPALFNTSRAVAPHMGHRRQGVIITITAPAGRLAVPGHLGHITTCAAEEAFARALASEVAASNIRVVCLKSHAIADAPQSGSFTGQLFAPKAAAMGLTVEQWLGGAAQGTMTKRLPTRADIAETVAFLASDHAAAMTASTVNMTGGLSLD